MLATTADVYTLIKYFEGKATLFTLQPELEAYKCPAKIWTIGWGTIAYPDGTPVREGDRCSVQQARRWLMSDVQMVASEVHALLFERKILSRITPSQFDALVSFGYNVGTMGRGLESSTLLRMITAGASPDVIDECFMMWSKANGEHDGIDNDGDGLIDEPGEKRMLLGLKLRRKSEAWLYRHAVLKLFAS